ncbi:MAG: hypothetical protein AAB074_09060 [Planctomycetota bacterium]
MKTLLRLSLLAACAAFVYADKVTLKDGRVFEGEIIEEDADHVKIKTAKTALAFKTEEIASVEKGMSPVQERAQRLEALDGENGAPYLETAVWLTECPKDVQDEKIIRRLCNAAAFLDPESAAAAQNLLGNWLLAAGKRPDAADAFARVLKVDANNANARKQLESLNTEIVAKARKDLEALKKAMHPLRELRFADAIPLMRKANKLYFADKCQQYVKMTIDELADDLQRRVPCASCKGAATRPCTVCKGKGTTECVQCKGTGIRKSAPPKPTFAQEICTHCYHTGVLLCTGCDAERWLTVHYAREVDGKKAVDIKIMSGVEKVELSKVLSLSKWTSRDGGTKITSIVAGAVVKGGTFTCRECKGIKFDPPPGEVNTFGITDYLNAIDARLDGKEKIEGVAIPEQAYDEADVADKKFIWKNGKWE